MSKSSFFEAYKTVSKFFLSVKWTLLRGSRRTCLDLGEKFDIYYLILSKLHQSEKRRFFLSDAFFTDTVQALLCIVTEKVRFFSFEQMKPTWRKGSVLCAQHWDYRWQNRKVRCRCHRFLKVALPQWRMS